jgi:hypothetical protein
VILYILSYPAIGLKQIMALAMSVKQQVLCNCRVLGATIGVAQ